MSTFQRVLSRLRPETSVLLIVDVQERLLPAIHEGPGVVEAARRLVRAASVWEVPRLLTEQYPQGLGVTCPELRACLEGVEAITKRRFSACVEELVTRLAELGRPHVVVAGIEAHVCVQQTVLDLLRLGYLPFVCADAVGARRQRDRDVALERMRQAGAVITTIESVIFEWTDEAGTERFKQILKIVK